MNGATVHSLSGGVVIDPAATLAPWQVVDPPARMVVVGAGRGHGSWAQAARRWAVPEVILIDADPTAAVALQRLVADWPGAQGVHAVLADAEGERAYHIASLSSESGLVDPVDLRGHYPHLATQAVEMRVTTTLDTVLRAAPSATTWLVVDCTGADTLLKGAQALLETVDLLVLRRYGGLTTAASMPGLEAHGLVLRATAEGLHPGIDYAIHTRDYRNEAKTLRDTLHRLQRDASDLARQLEAETQAHHRTGDALVGQTALAVANQQRAEVIEATLTRLKLEAEAQARQQVADRLALEHMQARAAAEREAEALHQASALAELCAQRDAERAAVATLRAEHAASVLEHRRTEAACRAADITIDTLRLQLDSATQAHAALKAQLDAERAAHAVTVNALEVAQQLAVDENTALHAQAEATRHTFSKLQAELELQQARATAAEAQVVTFKASAEDVGRDLVTERQTAADLERAKQELLVQLASAGEELASRPKARIDVDRLSPRRTVAAASTERPAFFSFWAGGALSPFEWLCLQSFADHGHDVTLYSHDLGLKVPDAVRLSDASEIMPADLLGRIRYDSGSVYAPYSDYFRCAGIQQTGRVWIDTDMLCLSDRIERQEGYLVAWEDAHWVNTGVLGLPADSTCLAEMIERCQAGVDQPDMAWGALGPKLLTPLLKQDRGHRILERFHFYPVHWRKAAHPFLPTERHAVRRDTSGAWGLHLWNEVITRSGYHKRLCPPVGSFLHDKIVEHGVLERFVDVLPEETMVRHASRFR